MSTAILRSTLPAVRAQEARATGQTSLRDRFVVVTGGTRGIGRAIVTQLASQGASVLIGARGAANDGLTRRVLDLTSTSSVDAFAQHLRREGRPIDMLVLSAGIHVPWKILHTADGHELHWQVNFLSNFLLVHGLLELCRRSELKRILYVASEAHRLAALPSPLMGFWRHYARSKEAAVSFFLQLQEQYPDLDVRVVSPGYVDTDIHDAKSAMERRIERLWARPRSAEDAARQVLSAFAPTRSRHVYWDRGCPAQPSARATDPARAALLWRESIAALGDHVASVRPLVAVRNYAGTFRTLGPAIERPNNVAELSTLVRRAADAKQSVRVVGRRHSYNDIFFSHQRMVSLERLGRVVGFDPQGGTITCEGGISIGDVCRHLDERGFALRYCGNFGEQTLAGALATGTHGYGREGGVMSELVRAVTLMTPDGRTVAVSDAADLRALRLSLGTLGVAVEVTLAIEKTSPCRYAVASMARRDFVSRLEKLAEANEYLRFAPHPFDAASIFYVTINRLPEGTPVAQPPYIDEASGGAARILVPALRMPAVRAALGRALSLHRRGYALDVPFSSMLFIRSGVVNGHPNIARAGQLALERHDWHNMELAVPRQRYADFERLFAEERPRFSGFSSRRPYYTCRVVGASERALLGPNYGRDIVFCDIHADKGEASSTPFLRRLEAAATSTLGARPHWGKTFFATHETIRRLYPEANIDAFVAAKRRFDPDGVFSNAYTRRVLGV